MGWSQALQSFCDLYAKSGLACNWIIVGSVGSVLQGADMAPNDLDLYVRDMDDLIQMADVLEPFSLTEKSEHAHSDPDWLSSVEEPYFTQSFPSGFTWSKGKWKIGGFAVEVVHISNSAGIPDSDCGDGIWEGGRHIWSIAKPVPFENHTVPVVPLEIQLESNMRRGRQDRVESIIQALHTFGYDLQLMKKALSDKNKELLKERLLM